MKRTHPDLAAACDCPHGTIVGYQRLANRSRVAGLQADASKARWARSVSGAHRFRSSPNLHFRHFFAIMEVRLRARKSFVPGAGCPILLPNLRVAQGWTLRVGIASN